MPRVTHVYTPDRRQERKKLFQDRNATALLRGLIVGPGDPATYSLVISAGRLFQLGLALLKAVESSAKPPSMRNLHRPRSFAHVRRGDRLQLSDSEVWTDLSDGAAVEASFLLGETFRGSALTSAIRGITPNGLRSAGRSGVLWLLSELHPGERVRLAEALSRPTRAIRPALFDRQGLLRIARVLHGIARSLEEG